MPRERFRRATGVTEETVGRFAQYETLLVKWQKAINLVGPKTLGDVWHRHFLDSAQFWRYVPAKATALADIGSGGGFPGLALAALAADANVGRSEFAVHLIESDQRKATFLREAARSMGLNSVVVHAQRIESMSAPSVDVVTARACAPLPQLLAWAAPMLERGALGIFAKGAQAEEEMASVAGYQIVREGSETDPAASLLLVRVLSREGGSHGVAA